MRDQDIHATFWEHVEDLRKTLMITFGVILAGMAVSLFFQTELLQIFIRPLENVQLALLSPAEGFLASLKIAFYLGILLSSPIWGWVVLKFIRPALKINEKKALLPFIFLSFIGIISGLGLAYRLTIPMANRYFFEFNHPFGVNLWSLSNYLDYTFLLLFSHAVVAECGVILLLCVHYGWLKAPQMREKRRHVIVGAFIVGALVTPPDVLSQLLVAVPLVILYEAAILYSVVRKTFN